MSWDKNWLQGPADQDSPLSAALSLLWTIHSRLAFSISKVRVSDFMSRTALKIDSYIYCSFSLAEFLLCARYLALP